MGRAWPARVVWATAVALFAACPAAAAASGYSVQAASFLGGSGDDDAVVGARILADGSVVLAANLAPDAADRIRPAKATGEAADRGTVLRLAPDGRRVVAMARIAPQVYDLALDAKDNVYVAAGAKGAVALAPDLARVLWTAALGGSCERLAAAADGHAAALVDGKRIVLLGPGGREVASFAAGATDVCIDGASRTIIHTGFRNARAHDGQRVQPVQICHLRGVGYDGRAKWSNYDWSTDRDSDRFINRPTNNMADTRAYRCTIGRDGKLYAGFEAAGGNHIFRYSPTDIMAKAPIVGGDQWHQFYASGADHKTIVGRFDPATGRLDRSQQFCARTPGGRTGNVRQKQGALAADQGGRVFITGYADPDLPLDLDPCPAGEPKGGPFLLGLTPDLAGRLVCTRMQGAGWSHALDVRQVGPKVRVVYGGSGASEGMAVRQALQDRAAGKDGFFVILEADPGAAATSGPRGPGRQDAPGPARPDADAPAKRGP